MKAELTQILVVTLLFFLMPPIGVLAESVRVAIRADTPPFSYLATKEAPGELSSYRGYVADICRRVLTEQFSATVEVQPAYSGPNRFQAIESGEVDVHCGPVSATLSRLKQFISSQPIFLSGTTYALGATNGVPIGRSLKIGFLKNTTALRGVEALELRKHFGPREEGLYEEIESAISTEPATVGIDFNYLAFFEAHTEGLNALCSGQIDYYVGDIDILTYYAENINRNGKCDLVVARRTITREIYVLLFSELTFMKNPSKGLNIIKAFQIGLHDLFQDGSISTIFRENFVSRTPSQELEAFFQSFNRKVPNLE